MGAEPDGCFGPRTAAAVLTELGKSADGTEDVVGVMDERTLKNIHTLDPKAQQRFVDFALLAKATAATFGCEYVGICGHRTWEEQDELFKRRPRVTKAAGGYSNHNFGIAMDFGVFQGKVYLDESAAGLAAKVHAAVAVHAKGCGLEWGGDWKKFPDIPHFELATGITLEAKRWMYKKHGSVL